MRQLGSYVNSVQMLLAAVLLLTSAASGQTQQFDEETVSTLCIVNGAGEGQLLWPSLLQARC